LGVAAVLAGAVVALPAMAGSETITAVNEGIYGHHWSPGTLTVSEGGVVTLSNPTEVDHGVEWRSGPTKPSCSGVPVGTSAAASGTNWSGTCTFTTPGVYTFYCTVHGPAMTGTITVNANGSTTTTMTGPATQPQGASTTPTTPAASPGYGPEVTRSLSGTGGSPLAGSASSALKLSGTQHGGSVHGSLAVSQAGSGGRLEVLLLARRASLASAARRSPVQVGRLVRSPLRAGTVLFTVALDAKARHALRLQRRLPLSARIVLASPRGSAVTITRALLVRP